MVCQDHPACSIGCSIPATSSTGLISNLRSSIVTHESIKKRQQSQYLQDDEDYEQYFTDRRYHSNRQQKRYSHQHQNRYLNQSSKTQFDDQQLQHSRPNRTNRLQPAREPAKKCFICKGENCWSTRHTQEEWDEAREKYTASLNKKLNRQFDQYLADDAEREDDRSDDIPDEFMDDFEALIVEVEGTMDTATNEPTIFVTETGDSIEEKNAANMVTELLNKATSHALLKDDNDEANIKSDNTSNSFITSDRYGPEQFYGIMVDTGAAGKSTAGYGQYIAYGKVFGKTHIDTGQKGAVKATFGIGSTTSIGSITIPTPISPCEFHVDSTPIYHSC